jgi:hypothetical protein
MRIVELARTALQAELLRYKAMAARLGIRAACGVAGLVFVLAVLAMLEAALWQVIATYILPIYATLSMMGVNLVIAAGFGFFAMRSTPGRTEIEALAVRKQAVTGMQRSAAFGALVPIATAVWRNRGRSSGRRRLLR